MSLIAIRTATLRANIMLGFDVYLLISGKHLLYVKRDDNIEEQRLTKLNEKNVRQVFIDEKDKVSYEEFLKASSKKALSDLSMPLKDRAMILGGQSKAAVEEMFVSPEKKENYTATQQAAANQVALLLKHPEALEQLLKIASQDKTVYQHSVNVSAIAVGLAAALGAPVNVCNAVAIGGLLHDIGRKGAPLERDEQHPRVGAQALVGKRYVSPDVLDIIVLHEERLDGQGYPSGVKKIDQIFQVVGLANLYDRMVTFEGKNPKEAYEIILKMSPAPYDDQLIEGLKDVLVANRVY